MPERCSVQERQEVNAKLSDLERRLARVEVYISAIAGAIELLQREKKARVN